VYHQRKVARLVVEGYALCAGEAGALFEQLFGNRFLSALELIRDADWLAVVLLHLEVGHLEIRRQHGCLEGATSCNAVC